MNPKPDADVEQAELEYKRSLLRSRSSEASHLATHAESTSPAGAPTAGVPGGKAAKGVPAKDTKSPGKEDRAPGSKGANGPVQDDGKFDRTGVSDIRETGIDSSDHVATPTATGVTPTADSQTPAR